jgi:outer membrane protein OmpA-like peptidoglycan-associated protein
MKTNELNKSNELNKTNTRLAGAVRFAAVTSLVLMLSACGSKQVRNPEALRVQEDLVALQADRNLAAQSPISMQEAEKAVQIALVPERDKVLSAHRVYLADRKVQTARSLAQAQYAIEHRKALSEESNEIRLNARTREADFAKLEAAARAQEAMVATNDANTARELASSAQNEASKAQNEASKAQNEASEAQNEASAAKSEAEARAMEAGNARTEADLARSETQTAKSDADMARIDAEIAKNEASAAMNEATIAKGETNAALDAADAAMRQNAGLLAQLADLQAKATDRGIQLTLGDVLFSTGQADLKAGSAAKLDQLAKALVSAPDRAILIEGFTDNVGSDASNEVLSQNRANTVSTYLTSQGVAALRITANGKGEALPVAGNENPAGRQLNRRVEVTIENPSK